MSGSGARDEGPIPVLVDEALGSKSREHRDAVAAPIFAPCSAHAISEDPAGVSEDPTRFLGLVLSAKRDTAEKEAIMRDVRGRYPQSFVCVAAAEPGGSAVPCHAAARHRLFEAGATMVSHVRAHVAEAKAAVLRARPTQAGGGLRCPVCACGGFTEDQLWWHLPAFHISSRSASLLRGKCPLCGERGTKYGRSPGSQLRCRPYSAPSSSLQCADPLPQRARPGGAPRGAVRA